jgi:hypothetical protein
VRLTDRMAAEVAASIQDCARWHATPRVEVRRGDPPEAAARIKAALSAMEAVAE